MDTAGGTEEFITMFIEESLIGGDDVLSRLQKLSDSAECGLNPADDVHYGIDFGIRDNGLEITR